MKKINILVSFFIISPIILIFYINLNYIKNKEKEKNNQVFSLLIKEKNSSIENVLIEEYTKIFYKIIIFKEKYNLSKYMESVVENKLNILFKKDIILKQIMNNEDLCFKIYNNNKLVSIISIRNSYSKDNPIYINFFYIENLELEKIIQLDNVDEQIKQTFILNDFLIDYIKNYIVLKEKSYLRKISNLN